VNPIGPGPSVEDTLRRARAAQADWTLRPVAERLLIVRGLRRRLAAIRPPWPAPPRGRQ
jgi:acyl-CoA reductase-like NAD-dependent aldehyde dehydrogenase